MYNEEYLLHYGVPGMKWGVRHDKERAAKRAAAEKRDIKLDRSISRAVGADQARRAQARADRKAGKIGRLEQRRRNLMSDVKYDSDNRIAKTQNKLDAANFKGKSKKAAKLQTKLSNQKAFNKEVSQRIKDSNRGYDRASKGERIARTLLSTGSSTTYYAARGKGKSKTEATLRQMGSDNLYNTRSGITNEYVQTSIAAKYSAKKKAK